jgi:predicted RecB family endonuclease
MEEILREHGVRLAGAGAKSNVAVDVSLRVINPGVSGYAGLIRVAVREPATLWATGQGVQAITSAQDLVFTTPKRDLHEYVRENLRDVVNEVIQANPRLSTR